MSTVGLLLSVDIRISKTHVTWLRGFFLICVVDFFFVLLKLKRYLVNVTPADGPTQRTHGEVQSEGSKIP